MPKPYRKLLFLLAVIAALVWLAITFGGGTAR